MYVRDVLCLRTESESKDFETCLTRFERHLFLRTGFSPLDTFVFIEDSRDDSIAFLLKVNLPLFESRHGVSKFKMKKNERK